MLKYIFEAIESSRKQPLLPLNNEKKLAIVKTIHTLIWLLFNVVMGYMLYAVITNRIGPALWIGFCLLAAEGLVLVTFHFSCPLTIVARKYSASEKDNFDIYLPNWLARNTKKIYTALAVAITIMIIFRLFKN